MHDGQSELEVGDLIEIKYRVARGPHGGGSTGDLADKWIAARIVHSEAGDSPVARLSDGQITDIRKFMTWRKLNSA